MVLSPPPAVFCSHLAASVRCVLETNEARLTHRYQVEIHHVCGTHEVSLYIINGPVLLSSPGTRGIFGKISGKPQQ